MAHLAKYKTTQVHGMNRHWSRYNWNYSNENINKELTHLNYNLAPARGKTWLNDMVEEHRNKHASKKNLNVLCDWVVTMPKEITDEDIQKRFFELTYEFLKSRYDTCDNIYSAYVHRDETTPHLHFAFIPITDKGNISADKVITRQDLRTFHDDFQSYIDEHLEYSCKVVNHDNISRSKSLNDYKKEQEMLRELKSLDISLEQKSRFGNSYKTSEEKKKNIDKVGNFLPKVMLLSNQMTKEIERKREESSFLHEQAESFKKQAHSLKVAESFIWFKSQDMDEKVEKTVQKRTESLTELNKNLKHKVKALEDKLELANQNLDLFIDFLLENKLFSKFNQYQIEKEQPKQTRKQMQVEREEEWER